MNLICGYRPPLRQLEFLEDNKYVCCYPHRVGRSMLLCGRKSSFFPFQLFVGPDWPCMVVTYVLIIVPTVLFIHNIAIYWGVAVVVVTVVLAAATLSFFSMAACSDPGIVFYTNDNNPNNKPNNTTEEDEENVEYSPSEKMIKEKKEGRVLSVNNKNSTIVSSSPESNTSPKDIESGGDNSSSSLLSSDPNSPTINTNNDQCLQNGDIAMKDHVNSPMNTDDSPAVRPSSSSTTVSLSHMTFSQQQPLYLARYVTNNTTTNTTTNSTTPARIIHQQIECGLCKIIRPITATHCYDCNVCIEDLDHHCPWTGKCIGKKTLFVFHGFLWCLCLLIGFVIVFVIVTAARGDNVVNFSSSSSSS